MTNHPPDGYQRTDAHYRRARERGATLVGESKDARPGFHSYRALHLEGHRWILAAPLGTHGREQK